MFDIYTLLAELQRNPIVGGAVSLVLSGFVLWGLTKAPIRIARLVRRFLFNELVFDNAMEHGQWRAYESALSRIQQESLSMALSGRATGSFNIQTGNGLVQGVSHRYCTVVQRGNGYGYSLVAKTDVRGTPPQHRDASSRALPPRPEGRGFTRKLMSTGCELRYRRQVSRRNPELHRLTFQLTCPDGSIRWTVITDQDIPRELGGDDSSKQDKTLQPVDEENHFVVHATPAPGALSRLLPLLNTVYHDAAKRRVTITRGK